MPTYDVTCETCQADQLDVFLQSWRDPIPDCPVCLGPRVKVWRSHANSVIGDECDVMVKHAICNEDGTPRRYQSRAEMAKAAAAKGMTNYFVHQPPRDSDKSKHSRRWF